MKTEYIHFTGDLDSLEQITETMLEWDKERGQLFIPSIEYTEPLGFVLVITSPMIDGFHIVARAGDYVIFYTNEENQFCRTEVYSNSQFEKFFLPNKERILERDTVRMFRPANNGNDEQQK